MTNNTPAVANFHRISWLFVWVLLAGILLPRLAAWGMFHDGVTYATISRNLSIGLGQWWKPYYTATLHPEFYEHPPLVFVIQSFFFTLFGDHYLVEKLYSLTTMLLSLIGIVCLWHFVTGQENNFRRYTWLPILLWLAMPRWQWAYQNNILENTLTVFCLLSFVCSFKALYTPHLFRQMLYAFCAGLMVFAAFLSKGPVGLFPLTAPLLYVIVVDHTDIRKGVSVTLVCIFSAVGLFGLLLLYEPAWVDLNQYFSHQVLASLKGSPQTGINEVGRLSFVFSMTKELIPSLVIIALIFVLARYDNSLSLPQKMTRKATACLLIALSGSLPVLFSYKQHSYYIVPTLPFFALACSLLLCPSLSRMFDRRIPLWKDQSFRLLHRIAMGALLCIGTVSLLLINRPYRDTDVFHDLQAISRIVPAGSTIGIHPSEWGDWELHAYLHRHLQISLDGSPTAKERPFYLYPVGAKTLPEEFETAGVALERALLLKKRPL